MYNLEAIDESQLRLFRLLPASLLGKNVSTTTIGGAYLPDKYAEHMNKSEPGKVIKLDGKTVEFYFSHVPRHEVTGETIEKVQWDIMEISMRNPINMDHQRFPHVCAFAWHNVQEQLLRLLKQADYPGVSYWNVLDAPINASLYDIFLDEHSIYRAKKVAERLMV